MSDPAPVYSIVPALAADIPTLGRLLYSAKLPVTVNRLLFENWPNEPAQVVRSTAAVERSFRSAHCEMLKVVENATGNIVGHLVLTHEIPTLEGSESAEQPEGGDGNKITEERGESGGMVPEVLDLATRAIKAASKSMQGVEHLAITHLYIALPARQHGIGKQLIELCKERGRNAAIPVFVSSEPQVRDFFLHFGFEEVDVADMALQDYAPLNSGFGNFRLSGMVYRL